MENKSSVIVAALVFLKHKGLCGWLADSNYFYRGINAMHKFLCMCKAICMHITYMVETVQVIGEGLIKSSFLAVIITPLPFLFLTSYSFYTQDMLILNLIDVQYLQNVIFILEKGSYGQNHFSGSCDPIKSFPSKISHSLHWREYPHPLTLFRKPCK